MSIDPLVEGFDVDGTAALIQTILEGILSTHPYDASKIDDWSQEIVDASQRCLSQGHGRFKTIVSAVILPKGDETTHMSNACLWDFSIDGSTIVK